MSGNGTHPRDQPNWNTDRHLDDETLSAYLDGRLDPAVQANVAAHLVDCTRCRRAQAELRATVRLLRSLPEPAAPRSFALTPTMLEARRPRVIRFMPHLRALTALAAMLLIFSVAGDLVSQSGVMNMATMQREAGAPAAGEAAPQPAAKVASAPEPTPVATPAAAPARAAKAEVAEATKPAAAPPAEATAATKPAAAAATAATPAPTSAPATAQDSGTGAATPSTAAAAVQQAPTATPASTAEAFTAPAATAAATTSAAAAQRAPTEEAADLQKQQESTALAAAETQTPGGWGGWRLLQIGFGLLTLALLATLLLAPRLTRTR
jgi:hypothetical protein